MNWYYVTQAFAGPCAFGGSAVCYKWIQYTYSLADPYNNALWATFYRGCMILGADPLLVGEADGFSRVTDLSAAGATYVAVMRPAEADATINTAAAGEAASPTT